MDIRKRIKDLPIAIKWRWIRGHAREKGYKTNWWTSMNEKMDKLAKDYMKDQLKNNREHCTRRLWYEKWALYVNGNKQPSINRNFIYDSLYGEKTLDYWRNHHDIPIDPSHEVDWEPARLAINRLSIGIRRFFWKYTSGHVGNRHMLWRREEIETPRCLLCNHDKEKSSHVLQCNNESTKLNFETRVRTVLNRTLNEQKTDPNLHHAIIDILCKWRNGTDINPNNYSEDNGLREAIRDQNNKLNWYHFMVGRWSPKWRHVQQRYLKSIQSKRSSLRWCTAIIYKLMYTVWDVWQYRNQLVFADDGELQTDERNRINNLIYQEFVIGGDDFLDGDQFLFTDYTLDGLLESDMDLKRSWLERTYAARRAIDLPEEEYELLDESNMVQLTFNDFGWID